MKNMKQTLKKKYLSGTSTHEDERQLLALLEQEPHPSPDDLALLSLLTSSVQTVQPCEAWLEEDESELFDYLMQERSTTGAQNRRPIRLAIRIIAAAAVLSGIVFLCRPLWQTPPDNMTVAYLYGNKIEDPRMSMDMMEETMTELFDRPDVESELAALLNQ